MGQVVLKEINKFYDGVHAVRDLNLRIRDKEFVVFVGPSGCGRTTTLRMIGGLEATHESAFSNAGSATLIVSRHCRLRLRIWSGSLPLREQLVANVTRGWG